jgi:hypothetical protein
MSNAANLHNVVLWRCLWLEQLPGRFRRGGCFSTAHPEGLGAFWRRRFYCRSRHILIPFYRGDFSETQPVEEILSAIFARWLFG